MRRQLGETRSSIQRRHALISPDSFERTTLPNWENTEIITTISPQMGADFTSYFANLSAESKGAQPHIEGVERFIFVIEGKVTLTVSNSVYQLEQEGFAYLPAGLAHDIQSNSDGRLAVLERKYLNLPNQTKVPHIIVGSTLDIPSEPMGGDDGLQLKRLMPLDNVFDFQMNTMEFIPGASLPYVETHFMEHALIMLDGGGIYRLDDQWYPVEKGDVIWMGPYCAQWFGAIGKTNARYLIYKIWDRDPMAVR